jgi:hypothetical protein
VDSEDSKKGKVHAFPKSKRQTPEELECLPLAHICVAEYNIQCFKWTIHLNGKGLHFLCSNCGLGMTLEEVLEAYEEP